MRRIILICFSVLLMSMTFGCSDNGQWYLKEVRNYANDGSLNIHDEEVAYIQNGVIFAETISVLYSILPEQINSGEVVAVTVDIEVIGETVIFGSFGEGVAYIYNDDREDFVYGDDENLVFVSSNGTSDLPKRNKKTLTAKIPKGSDGEILIIRQSSAQGIGYEYIYEWIND